MRTLATALILTALLSPVAGCGGEGGGEAPAPATPSKAGLVQVLRDLEAALGKGDVDKAFGYMAAFPGVEITKLKQSLVPMTQREGLTPANIDRLEAVGKYGPLLEVFPKRGKNWAERVKLDAAKCYALGAGSAEVAAHWDGKGFRLLRLDDLNKIDSN